MSATPEPDGDPFLSTKSQSEAMDAAFAAHDQRDWTQAVREYRRYLREGGALGIVADALGDVLSELTLFEDARATYAAALQADPENAGTALRLGRAAERLGNWPVARDAVRSATRSLAADHQSLALGVGPLPLHLSELSAKLLDREGWRLPALDRPPAPEAQAASPGLALTAVDSVPSSVHFRLVASARWRGDGLSSAEALSLAKLAESAAPGAAVTLLFHEDAHQARAEASALRGQLQHAGLCGRIFAHEGAATTLQLQGLSVRIAAAYGADALCATAMPLHASCPPADTFDDPMLGFACWQPGSSDKPWSRAPCGAAPLVLIRDRVLQEAGQLDHYYESFPSAMSDLMLRANRMGFSVTSRAARYLGPAPCAPDEGDERLLHLRYPEHRPKLRQAAGGVPAEARRLVEALATPRDVALDLTGLRAWHDGTSALSVAIATALAHDSRFDLKLLCSEAAARHHGLDRLAGARVVNPQGRPRAAACFKVGQPFTREELLFTWSVAPVAGFYMLDAISLDVERLSVDVNLDLLWRLLFEHSELVGYLSRYTRDQMGRRFGRDGERGFVALCSTAIDEYAALEGDVGDDVLLVGNAYEHKNLVGAVRAIHARSPQTRLNVLGRVLESRPNVTWLDSGTLPHNRLQQLYAEARAVVFPSLYEGFGLPIMHGLAARRPVLAINQPVFREIRDRTRWGAGLHLFLTTTALAENLDKVCRAGFPSAPGAAREQRWSDAARTIGDAVADALAGFDPDRLTRRVVASQALDRG